MRTLSSAESLRLRWSAQLLGGSDLTPAQVVDRAVALQGQDLPAVLRAIAMRARPGTTVDDVRAAFDRGEIVRSWPVRGTLFATTRAHLASLLSMTRERLIRSLTRRRQQLGLDDDVLARARSIAQEVLADRGLTRAELLEIWADAGVDTAGGRGYHLIVHHAIAGAWHWGAFRGAHQTLVPTPEFAPADHDPLVEIVRGLVAARGPVTDSDLAWWLKLPKTRVRAAVADAGLTAVSVDGAPAWVVGDPDVPARTGVTLVPAFDEWILGYEDRSLTASPAMQRALVPGNNGVFRPAVLVDGVTVGTWQGRAASRPEPSFALVEDVPASMRKRIAAAVAASPLA